MNYLLSVRFRSIGPQTPCAPAMRGKGTFPAR